MQTAEAKAATYAAYVEHFLRERSCQSCTMTDATQAIWGTSGRGNPTAVRIIEATAVLGFLEVKKVGKRKRLVRRTDKPIPPECFEYAGISDPRAMEMSA